MRRKKIARKKRLARPQARRRTAESPWLLQLSSAFILAAIAVSAAYFAYQAKDLNERNPAAARMELRALPDRPAYTAPKY